MEGRLTASSLLGIARLPQFWLNGGSDRELLALILVNQQPSRCIDCCVCTVAVTQTEFPRIHLELPYIHFKASGNLGDLVRILTGAVC